MIAKLFPFLCLYAALVLPGAAFGTPNPVMTDEAAPTIQQAPAFPPLEEANILPDVKMHDKTNPERILFTHYKLADVLPDLDTFAKLSPRVGRAQDIDKSAMTISEYNRMSNHYNLMDAREPIVVHTRLEVDEYSSLQDMMRFDELNDKTYFRYPVYGENIGIVVNDITRFSRMLISKPTAEAMFEAMAGGVSVLAEFILLPEYADRQEPFVHDETEYWLMLAKVAELRLWARADDDNPILVWYYRNPDYKPEDKSGLGNLYGG